MDGTEHPYPTTEYPSLPPSLSSSLSSSLPKCSSASEISWNAKGLTSSVT